MLTEHSFFKRCQIAVLQTQPVHAPRSVQQIEVRHLCHRQTDAVHDHAGFQQRQVKRLAVEGDDRIRLTKQRGDLRKHRRLLAVIAHDILSDHHAAVVDESHADLKRHGTRAAAQAGRLRIQEQHAADIPAVARKARIARADFVKRRAFDAAKLPQRYNLLAVEEWLLFDLRLWPGRGGLA